MTDIRATASGARRLKRFILGEMQVSPSLYARAKFSGSVTVNGLPARGDQLLCPGDEVRLSLEERPAYLPRPCNAAVSVVYEDAHLMIVNKPAPMACQSSREKPDDTLENCLFARLGCPADFVYRPVNRLDGGTSGLMVIARSAHVHDLLQRQLHTPSFTREYWGLALGIPDPAAGRADAPIGRGEGVRRQVSPQGQRAVTHYRTLARARGLSLIHFQLDTGRTHQIRVHMAHLGHPLMGDWLYGREDPRLPGRFALHCFRLTLRHPITGQWLRLSAPPPDELKPLLNAFKRKGGPIP